MSEQTRLSTTTKVATLLLLLANYAVTVNASPLGTADMSISRFYWVLLLVFIAILSLMYYLTKTKSPVEVVGLAYDKANHKIELTVRNSGDESYCIKSAMRLLQPAQDVIHSATSDGTVPMAAARASVGSRRLFQLLAEDDAPVVLEPNETRTIAYDLALPPQYLKLDASKNVEVHISYTEDEGESSVLAAQADDQADGFCIRMESGEVVAEVFLLEDLLAALNKSPDEAVSFHMRDGNELALWVRNVVGDNALADELAQVKLTDPSETKKNLIKLIDSKVESLKHPYLRKVKADSKFILKSGHDQVLSEVIHLEELAETLAKSSADAVSFHTRDGNDFASWVNNVVGDAELAVRLQGIKSSTPDEAKDRIVSAIRERVDSIKCQSNAE